MWVCICVSGFASLALFNLLRFPLMALPEALTHLFQAHVALQRIQRFLQRPEVRKPQSQKQTSRSPKAITGHASGQRGAQWG